jgi:hypothetical protein
VLISSPSARCLAMANNIYQFMDVFSANTVALDDLFCYAI